MRVVGSTSHVGGLGRLAVAGLLAAAVGVVACGSSGSDSTSTTSKSSSTTQSKPAAAVDPSTAGPPPGGYITDFVKYMGGKPGAADSSLPPVKIGWTSNQDGSIVSIGPQATDAAQFSIDWINKYAGGVGGHPIVLDKCLVKNAAEEAQKCGQQFLNDKGVNVISYGALSVGASTIDSTIAGKKPIIFGFSFDAADLKTPNLFVLGPAGPFAVYPFGTIGSDFLKAKTAALVHPETAAWGPNSEAIKKSLESAGVKVKMVSFDAKTSDLVGPLTAAGAQSADMVTPMVNTPSNCLAAVKALKTLNIDPNKVVWFTLCAQPALLKGFGGDYPKYISGISQSGDALADTPTGKAFVKTFTDMGKDPKLAQDPWYSGMFGQLATITQFMNKVGYDKLSPEAIIDLAKKFKGPQLLGGPVIDCGKYPDAPASCGDGNYFFKYEGDGKWSRVTGWLQPPPALQKELGATG
jgi:branched-chain amino acid transport system substrate-binding protein